jgi:transcriptional antiterminator NusG
MEEERFELVELETTESENVQEDAPEDAPETALEPEDRARKLFASYLEPSKDELEPKEGQEADLPDPTGEPDLAVGHDELFLVDDASAEDASEGDALDGDVPPGKASPGVALLGKVSEDQRARAESGEDDEEPGEGGRNWFVIHSYSGYENKVKKNLEHRIESLDMQNKIFEVVVPTEEEIELKDGQRRTVERRIFPGYILVDMIMDEDSWYVVRNTPGVTGFVGSIRKPTPLRQRDVDRILKRMRAETPRVKVTFLPGQKVRIADGPFEDFVGSVDDIYPDKGKVRILVSFFGRETPVELDFLQVEKI